MRLGIIGGASAVAAVVQIVQDQLGDVQSIPRTVDYVYQALDAAIELQSDGSVDALLFTQAQDFHHVRMYLTPTLPWRFIPQTRSALMVALLKATTETTVPLKGISVDWEDTTLLQEVLADVGLAHLPLLAPPHSAQETPETALLVQLHRHHYQSGRVSLCLTHREPVYLELTQLGVPTHPLLPGVGVVMEQVYRLRIMGLDAHQSQGQLAVIAVRFEYFFDGIGSASAREWKKLKYHNAFREQIHITAQQMQAAVFASGTDYFYMITTQDQMNRFFLQNQAYLELLQFGRQAPERLVWAGIGVGDSALEARSRATMALNQSTSDAQGHFHLVTGEGQAANPLAQPDPDSGLMSRLHHLHLHTAQLTKLRQVLATHGTTTTSDELALHLGVTSRSANRILAQLEDAGLVQIVGTRSTGKGRPARVLQINLPPQ